MSVRARAEVTRRLCIYLNLGECVHTHLLYAHSMRSHTHTHTLVLTHRSHIPHPRTACALLIHTHLLLHTLANTNIPTLFPTLTLMYTPTTHSQIHTFTFCLLAYNDWKLNRPLSPRQQVTCMVTQSRDSRSQEQKGSSSVVNPLEKP